MTHRVTNSRTVSIILVVAFLLTALASFAGAQEKGTPELDSKHEQSVIVPTISGPNVAPPTPPICTTSGTTNFSDSPAAAITDNSLTTATLVVSGVTTYLWDLDLTTAIVHTFPGDLDMTLTSPAGTVVTISTDNGGSSDDAFDGTLFDDDADTPVTDASYSTGVTATPLVPEGAFAALIGEDPNGTWTLDIFDDAGGDSGTLNSWALDIVALDAAPSAMSTASASDATVLPITDNSTITSTIVVAGAFPYLSDVNLTTNIVHTFAADLEMTLTSPAGTVVTISTDNGGSSDDVFDGSVFDDGAADTVTDFTYTSGVTAGPLIPEEAMGAFIGEDPNGTWTLEIFDDAGADTGSLNGWSMDMEGVNCAPTDVALTSFGEAAGLPAASLVVAALLVVLSAGAVIRNRTQI